MSFLSMALRMIMSVISHPFVHELARHAVRMATVELVRQIQHQTRKPHSVTRIH